MNARVRLVIGATIAAIAVLGAVAGCRDTASPATSSGVAALRASLDPYVSFALAQQGGYNAAITDCLSNGDEGAMGFHYAKPALLDDAIDSLHPEVLVYEPGTNGSMNLVGVEFVVPFAIRPKTATPPELFGQKFMANDVFGVWGLHVWTHRDNPSGMFAMWNPRVHC